MTNIGMFLQKASIISQKKTSKQANHETGKNWFRSGFH